LMTYLRSRMPHAESSDYNGIYKWLKYSALRKKDL
jgi:hypothetical protein